MNRKLLVGLLVIIICFALVGCGKEETPNNNNNTKQVQEEPQNNIVGVGKYKVEKGNNSVIIITNDGSGIATTTYYFTNGIISNAELVEEFSSTSIAKTSYDTMKNEPSIMNSYSDIKLDGKKIIFTFKSEILDAYSTFSYDEFYDFMYGNYEMYMD